MEQNRFRCHFSIVFENLGSTFWFLAVMLLCQLDDLDDMIVELVNGNVSFGEAFLVIGILFGILLIVFLYNLIVWSQTWISIEKDAIVIERRTLNRKINTIGMQNISNINTEQNLFERVIGTYKIKLDTNSKTTADSTDVKIVLSKPQAEYLKQQVLLRMNDIQAVEEDSIIEEYDVQYSAKDIILHCCYTASVTSVLFLLGIVIGFVVMLRMARTGVMLLDSIVNVVGGLVAALIVVISVIQSLVKDFFVYYGFKARRIDNKIYLQHGLLKKRQYTLAVDKINAVKVVSTTFSRMLKRQYVKLICIGVGDEENENSMLLLSETKEDMYRKLSVLLPEFVLEEAEITKREKQSVCSELPGMIFLYGIMLTTAIVIGIINIFDITQIWIRILVVIACLLVIGFHILAMVLHFYTCGIHVGRNVLTLVNGTFQKEVTWIPYSKIQQITYQQGPICRHFGLAQGTVSILARMLDSYQNVSYFKVEVFDLLREKILLRRGMQSDKEAEISG